MGKTKPVVMGVALILLSMIFSFGAVAQIPFSGNLEGFEDIGDYIEMRYSSDEDGTGLSGHMRMELTCDETVRVQGNNYECHVISIKGSGDLDTGIGAKGDWEITGDQYCDKTDGRSVKSESLMDTTMELQGITVKVTTDITSEQMGWSSNWTSEEDKDIGDCWKETQKIKTVTKTTADTPAGVETDSETTTDTTVTCYEYVDDENVNTDLGTRTCRVIQSYDEVDIDTKDDNYMISYIDKDLDIPVKVETYEDGDPVFTTELISYKIGSDKAGTDVIGPIGGGEDKGLLGLGKFAGIDLAILVFIAVLAAIVILIAVLLLAGHKKTTPADTQYPGQQAVTTRQPAPPPRPPQQPAPPSQMSTYNCPHCGKPFSAQPSSQPQQVSCPSCRGQVTINPQQPQAPAPKPQQAPQRPPQQRPPQPVQEPPVQKPVQEPKKEPPREPQQPAQPTQQIPQQEPQPQQPAPEPQTQEPVQQQPVQQTPQQKPQPQQPTPEPQIQEPVQEPPTQTIQDEPILQEPAQGSPEEPTFQQEPQPEQSSAEPQQQPQEQPAQTQPAQPSKQPETTEHSPMYILKMRLAKGEIDLDTYRELKKEIE